MRVARHPALTPDPSPAAAGEGASPLPEPAWECGQPLACARGTDRGTDARGTDGPLQKTAMGLTGLPVPPLTLRGLTVRRNS
jgi:hypothetical protein